MSAGHHAPQSPFITSDVMDQSESNQHVCKMWAGEKSINAGQRGGTNQNSSGNNAN